MAPQAPSVVLVVEDDDAVRLLIVETLRRADPHLELLEASDGVEAQTILRSFEVDVVITDVIMPRLDGLQLMRWAREASPRPVWIINSGLDTFNAAAEAIELGAFAFIPKESTSIRALPGTVKNAMERRRLLDDRERLTQQLNRNNEKLREKVAALEYLCDLLSRQAKVIESDLERAKRIQRALLPDAAPSMGGLSVCAFYRPSKHVGGDLYDVMRLDSRHVAVYVADAAGHGVAAAMLSVLFKHRLVVRDADGEPLPPSAVLRRVNAAVYPECNSHALFLTAAYAMLDLETRELAVAVAGHPALIRQCTDNSLDRIEATGPALGLVRDAVFGEERRRLRKNDRVVFYTDGLLETLSDEEHAASAADVAQAVLDGPPGGKALLTHLIDPETVHDLPDDVTVLVLSSGGERSTFDNGDDDEEYGASLHLEAQQSELLLGAAPDTMVLCVRGRGTWTDATALLSVARTVAEEGMALAVDLSRCSYLDSTALGTLHEIVGMFNERGQGVSVHKAERVRSLFEELGMQGVLDATSVEAAPPARRLTPIETGREDVVQSRQRVLDAHVALAGIGEGNKREFSDLICALRSEILGEG